MSDTIAQTPEAVALELLKMVANVEGRQLYRSDDNPADRAYIFSTYAECLAAVRGGGKAPMTFSKG